MSTPVDQMGGISPELIAAMGGVSATPEKNAVLMQQMQLADAMRQKAPGTQMAGRVAIHNSPFQYLASGLSNYAANQTDQQAMAAMGHNAMSQQDARTKLLNAIAQQQQMGGGQVQQLQQPNPQTQTPMDSFE